MARRRRIQKKDNHEATATMAPPQLNSRPFVDNVLALADALGPDLTSMPVQPKLTVGAPDDKYEQEADQVAAKVVQQINAPQTAQREEESLDTAENVAKNGAVQRKSGIPVGPVDDNFETTLNRARGGGQSLDSTLQTKMGTAMGADFSGVKIHTDTQSDTLSSAIQAKAFTTGKDVFFTQGEYNPNSRSGQSLIAHELTHVVQQNTGIQRKPTANVSSNNIGEHISQTTAAHLPIQRLMSGKDFKSATKGTLTHPRKRITAIDAPLKKIDQSGMDHILLTELLDAINGWLAVASEESSRKPIVIQLRDQVLEETAKLSESLNNDFDPENLPPTRQRRNAFSAKVTGSGKKYSKDFSDFDSKQFRVSGRAPTRRIEEVKRTTMEDGTVAYYATGLVTRFKGKAPVVAPYPEPVPLGDWYPKVTHINGMAVAPKSGILSAAALQETVNKALGGQDDVAFGQDAVDILYTYSAQRGNVVVDVFDCIKGKISMEDDSTKKQEEIMIDAVRRKKRVTVSAHSRGTIKTDNAVRSAHKALIDDFLPDVRQESYEDILAYWRVNDPGLGLDPEIMAEMSLRGFAATRAKQQMNAYIHLVYAGNAVQHPSAFVDISIYVGGLDPISMFVGTYSETGRKIDATLGTGGSKGSKLHSVGKTSGHGFTGNYVSSVGQEIADDIEKR